MVCNEINFHCTNKVNVKQIKFSIYCSEVDHLLSAIIALDVSFLSMDQTFWICASCAWFGSMSIIKVEIISARCFFMLLVIFEWTQMPLVKV